MRHPVQSLNPSADWRGRGRAGIGIGLGRCWSGLKRAARWPHWPPPPQPLNFLASSEALLLCGDRPDRPARPRPTLSWPGLPPPCLRATPACASPSSAGGGNHEVVGHILCHWHKAASMKSNMARGRRGGARSSRRSRPEDRRGARRRDAGRAGPAMGPAGRVTRVQASDRRGASLPGVSSNRTLASVPTPFPKSRLLCACSAGSAGSALGSAPTAPRRARRAAYPRLRGRCWSAKREAT